MPVEISPSFLTADLTRLDEQINEALQAGAERIHVDVMDGRFVPNLTFGPLVVAAIKPLVQQAGALLEAHLMIEEPENLIPEFSRAGVDLITVHVETCPHLNRTIQQIKNLGLKAGITLNPGTPLVTLEHVLGEVDLVLVMSV
ncbi:MAG: ribulose-phosphate 3-epimerase, partial [Anaerolineales bacterium]